MRVSLPWQGVHVAFYIGDRHLQVFEGAKLCTQKLHIAACHLPDQVRACGAAYLFLEYWVERLVQLVKRFIKYRSTGCPELLFVNGHLLVRACRQMLLERGGAALREMEVAVQHAIKERRKRRRQRALLPADVQPGCGAFEGAARPLEDRELQAVIASETGDGPLTGLGLVLETAPELEEEARWPTHPDEDDLSVRRAAIVTELGLQNDGVVPADGVSVHACKFMRATLRDGVSASCRQNKSQVQKDDRWCLMHYLEGPDGFEVSVPYVVHIQYFVQAVIRSENGLDCPPRIAEKIDNFPALGQVASAPLGLAMVDLYACTVVTDVPGLRTPSPDRPPEYVYVPDLRPGHGPQGGSHAGTLLVLLDQIDGQLVPVQQDGVGRYFMTHGKTSGRTGAIRSCRRPVPVVM